MLRTCPRFFWLSGGEARTEATLPPHASFMPFFRISKAEYYATERREVSVELMPHSYFRTSNQSQPFRSPFLKSLDILKAVIIGYIILPCISYNVRWEIDATRISGYKLISSYLEIEAGCRKD